MEALLILNELNAWQDVLNNAPMVNVGDRRHAAHNCMVAIRRLESMGHKLDYRPGGMTLVKSQWVLVK